MAGRLSLLLALWGCTPSAAEERALGEAVAAEVERNLLLLDERDPVSQWAVSLLGPLVEASAPLRDPDEVEGYRLRVVRAPEANAFAAPGGHLYLTTGLILEARSCAEVVDVLAHEVAHVVHRHGAKRRAEASTASCVGQLVLGDSGTARTVSLAAGVLAGPRFSRQDEAQADRTAVGLAADAGYDPTAVADFHARHAHGAAGYFDSHPAGAARVAAIQSEAEALPSSVSRRRCLGTMLRLAEVQRRLKSPRGRPR